MKEYPKISVIMPSYNQVDFLTKTLQSVIEQDYPNLEWLVLDGGSSDGSVAILESYARHFTWWRSSKDAGQTAALAEGFARCSGDILCWLNSDDLFAPGCLTTVAEIFSNQPTCEWLAGACRVIDPSGQTLHILQVRQADFDSFIRFPPKPYLAQPSVFWRRSLWQRSPGLNLKLRTSMDYELWLRFYEAGGRVKCIDNILSAATWQPNMKTQILRRRMIYETCKCLFGHTWRLWTGKSKSAINTQNK